MPEYPHFVLPGSGQPQAYTAVGGGSGKFTAPPRDRPAHAHRLLDQLRGVRDGADAELAKTPASSGLHHIPVVFEGATDAELDVDRLESLSEGILLVNVRTEGKRRIATVAVPRGKTAYFEKRLQQYASKNKESGGPRHEKLVTGIQEIRLAVLADYYMDSDGVLPPLQETLWWEVWLDTNAAGDAVSEFRDTAAQRSLQVSENEVRFPEVAVVLAEASLGEWLQFPRLLNLLTELRRASVVPSEFVSLAPKDQADAVQKLQERTQSPPGEAPAVCLLDTGVNRGHELLAPALSAEDAQSWKPAWGSGDRQGHGTELAGLALYGPLEGLLDSRQPLVLTHRLESVKILPDVGQNAPPDYGPITVGSMAMAEQNAPHRPRTFCLAVTADDRDRGTPTLWSAAIDQACSGAEDDHRRLMVVSAGNLVADVGVGYPDTNHLASTQDPSQSWNCLTVGACTAKAWMQEEDLRGWTPIARPGGLCPSSTTSIAWDDHLWPLKPDVVFEGGNYAADPSGMVTGPDDLGLLTTRFDRSGARLGISRDTSAATAQVARMAAMLQSEYREFWPESIRGLLVHSAEWTEHMLKEFPHKQRKNRLRCYGWGIPDFDRARACAKNVATLVIEDKLRPFHKDGSEIKSHQMNLHALPFPTAVLRQLGETRITMRVTLSYFIEPSPGRRGWDRQHRYASHGLRFDVIRPNENESQYRKRLTRDAWDDRTKNPGGAVKENRSWTLGETLRSRGSVQSDWWSGTAGELALSGKIAVFPITGWWRERPSQQRYDRDARYSLIVTISTPGEEVELYSAVRQAISTPVVIPT